MRPKMKHDVNPKWVFGSALSLTVALLFVFQNCADPLDIAQEDQSSFASKLPFAYDFAPDQISYMSCSEINTPNTATFYSLAAGAYQADDIDRIHGGGRFTDAFTTEAKKLNADQKGEILSQGDVNSDAALHLSVRNFSNFQGVYTSSGSARRDYDYDLMVRDRLDSPQIGSELGKLMGAERASFFPQANLRIEGFLRFMSGEAIATDVRNQLTNTSFLSLTYGNFENDELVARAPRESTNPSRFVHGMGFQMSFTTGFYLGNSSSRFARGQDRLMTSIEEYNLESGRPTGAYWDCPSDARFLIVRPGDEVGGPPAASCDKVSDGSQGGTGNSRLQQVRQFLRGDKWWVDMNRKCVIPKNSSDNCYGRTSGISVDYSGSGNVCGDLDAEGRLTADQCPHYVSFCFRTAPGFGP